MRGEISFIRFWARDSIYISIAMSSQIEKPFIWLSLFRRVCNVFIWYYFFYSKLIYADGLNIVFALKYATNLVKTEIFLLVSIPPFHKIYLSLEKKKNMNHEYMTLRKRDDEKIRNSFDFRVSKTSSVVMLTDSLFRYPCTS